MLSSFSSFLFLLLQISLYKICICRGFSPKLQMLYEQSCRGYMQRLQRLYAVESDNTASFNCGWAELGNNSLKPGAEVCQAHAKLG